MKIKSTYLNFGLINYSDLFRRKYLHNLKSLALLNSKKAPLVFILSFFSSAYKSLAFINCFKPHLPYTRPNS